MGATTHAVSHSLVRRGEIGRTRGSAPTRPPRDRIPAAMMGHFPPERKVS
jgi:hypothetical protein